MRFVRKISVVFVLLLATAVAFAQGDGEGLHRIEKQYNIFFKINLWDIDKSFKDNARTIERMRQDIETTLEYDKAVPDSILILSTASPDGSAAFNKKLAMRRAQSTSNLLHSMFPQFKDSNIKVEYLDEDWGGLRQVLKANADFPQRKEMLAIIESDINPDTKEARLRQCKAGWRHLVNNYIYVLRNSSVTITVIGKKDEYAISEPLSPVDPVEYTPTFEQPFKGDIIAPEPQPVKFRKTLFAARTNLLMPGLSIGIEIPIREHWSVGFNYSYPWAVSEGNKWCVEKLSWFVDAKYWFTNDKTRWMPDSKLKGHGVGLYAGTGYYDFQNKIKGAQGEFIDFGVDYTYALPVANDKLRFEFNIGLGFMKTWYRPYTPSSDYSDLIKEPGVKYRSTNFVGPTRAGVSLVYPITVTTKKSPYLKMVQREQRKADRKAARTERKGGKND